MKAKYTVGIVAAVAAIGAAIILIQQRPAQAPHKVLSPSTNTTVTPIATTTPAPGRYTDYSPEAMSAPNYTETILFFHAHWCPECRAYNSVLNYSSDRNCVVFVNFVLDYLNIFLFSLYLF